MKSIVFNCSFLFFLFLSTLLETVGQISNLVTFVLGGVFLISRIAHAYGITRPEAKSIFRMLGAVGSLLVLLVQSVWALIVSISWLSNNNFGI
jgi:uncharacterized membrane protein YecN with MAPEG domain